jgi:hypothetical protein
MPETFDPKRIKLKDDYILVQHDMFKLFDVVLKVSHTKNHLLGKSVIINTRPSDVYSVCNDQNGMVEWIICHSNRIVGFEEKS